MFHKKLLALAGGVMALAVLGAQPALAQVTEDRSTHEQSDRASGQIRGESVLPGRLTDGASERRDRRNRREQNQDRREAPAPTPEENKAAAQALLTGAGIECQVSEAALLGVTAEQHSTYEAVCANASGYLVVGSTPPQTFNCIELAGQAETSRLRDPAADVGQQCSLPANLNAVPVLSAYAREAGIDCTVDQAAAIGKSTAGNLIYEIGCSDRDGFWIEKVDNAWVTTPCWDLVLDNEACRYSSESELDGAWTRILTGTEAAACDVGQARRVGKDARGLSVYEVKCGAGDGWFARIGQRHTAEVVLSCAAPQAAGLAGGCQLTTAAPAAPAEQ